MRLLGRWCPFVNDAFIVETFVFLVVELLLEGL